MVTSIMPVVSSPLNATWNMNWCRFLRPLEKNVYHDILKTGKVISELAASSLMQDTHMKLATALRLEDAQRQLKKLYEDL